MKRSHEDVFLICDDETSPCNIETSPVCDNETAQVSESCDYGTSGKGIMSSSRYMSHPKRPKNQHSEATNKSGAGDVMLNQTPQSQNETIRNETPESRDADMMCCEESARARLLFSSQLERADTNARAALSNGILSDELQIPKPRPFEKSVQKTTRQESGNSVGPSYRQKCGFKSRLKKDSEIPLIPEWFIFSSIVMLGCYGLWRLNHRLCPAGYESNAFFFLTDKKCVMCSAGKFKPSNGYEVCETCPANHYSPHTGSTQCQQCQIGSVSRRGSSRCQLPGTGACPKGYYDSGYLPEKCTACTAGKFKDTSGPGHLCLDCPRHTYSPTAGSSKCSACPAGSVSEAGSAQCRTCPPGTFRSATDQDAHAAACRPCPVNSYAPQNGSVGCHKCPKGSVSAPSSAACAECPANTYASSNGTCVACSEGSQAGEGSVRCSCKRGWTHQFHDDSNHLKYYKGEPWELYAGFRCVKCPENMYKASVGNGHCQPCPKDFSSPQGAADLSECQASSLAILSYAIMGSDDDKVQRWLDERKRAVLQSTELQLQSLMAEASLAVESAISRGHQLLQTMRSFCTDLFGSWEAFQSQWMAVLKSCPDGGTYCYGANGTGCCETCDDVQRAFAHRGWAHWWRTPLCGSRTEAPCHGGPGGCPTCTDQEFTAWFEATAFYSEFTQALRQAAWRPGPEVCRRARRAAMGVMLQVHPDKYDAAHPMCPRGVSTAGAQRVNEQWSSLMGKECKAFVRGSG